MNKDVVKFIESIAETEYDAYIKSYMTDCDNFFDFKDGLMKECVKQFKIYYFECFNILYPNNLEIYYAKEIAFAMLIKKFNKEQEKLDKKYFIECYTADLNYLGKYELTKFMKINHENFQVNDVFFLESFEVLYKNNPYAGGRIFAIGFDEDGNKILKIKRMKDDRDSHYKCGWSRDNDLDERFFKRSNARMSNPKIIIE